jgi:hypothetical protein
MKTLITAMAALALVSGAWAQAGNSAITGNITDASGGALPSVSVKVVNQNSGAQAETLSNDAGMYRFNSLVPGTYRIEALLTGFSPLSRANISVTVGQVLAVDLTLQVGQTSETVNVEATAPLTETQTSSISQVVNRKMVAGMPMPNRAATSLVALAPGVVMIDQGQGAENYPVFSVAGGRARNQNFTLDGGNVTNAVGLTRPQQMTSLPMDAMQEFRVLSNTYSAEYGHSTGGIIELTTRSGTNELHGSVFEFVRNNALDARNFFSAEKQPLRMHQFGAAVGGPVQKDKTHFFVSWEQTRQLTSFTLLQTVPDELQRSGDFSQLRDANGRQVEIYDPATTVGRDRQPFPGNRIPESRFDPVAKALISYYPLPNRQGSASGANNYGSNADSALHRNIVVGKLDHQLGVNDHFTARYYINDSFIDNKGSFPNPVAAPDSNTNDARIQSILGSHTHTFGPTLLNEVKVSFLQRKFIDARYGYDSDVAGELGLRGVSRAAFPWFTVPGYAALGGNVSRIQTPIRDTQVQDAISYFRGRHAFKAGLEYRRGSNNELRDRSSSGQFGITPLITSLPGVAGTGNAIASLLLGEVNSVNINVSDQILSRAAYWAWYVQDDWRITDRFTLNYGLRWESEMPRRVDGDMQNSFDPYTINPVSGTPGVVTFSGRNGVPRQAFNTDWNNFGPRLGFAYRAPIFGETVIRGGVGVFYGPTVSNSIGDVATAGFSTSVSLVVPQADVRSALRLRDGVPAVGRPELGADYGAVALGERPNLSVGFFERDRPTPISYQYNLNVEKELPANTVVEIGYMANVSHHLTANDLSINQVTPELMGPGDSQAQRPFPQFSNVFILNPAVGNSTYHAGFLKAEKRYSAGFSFLAHYTFSKFIDDVASSNEYGDPASYMDAYNRRLDKSLSGSDVPHRLVLSGIYEAKYLRGWKFGVFATLQSGAPFTVVTAANTTNAFSAGPMRPDVVRSPVLPPGERTLSHWFDTAAFRAPAPFTFGNSGRSNVRGPSQKTVDLTAEKEFGLSERYHLNVRGEFYNVLNHANFDLPGHVLGAADFGAISSARPGRTIQLGLRLLF